MPTKIVWAGIEYHSLEYCVIENGEINSVITGDYHDVIYRVEYKIKVNQSWETVFAEIKSHFNGHADHFKFESDGKGNWLRNGKPANEFESCIDIDISLTPFTNTLPVNRLKLSQGEGRQIKVLYFDLLNHQTKAVWQKYTRLSTAAYRYENIPNDFEAVVTVDEQGFVIDYPLLFERKAIVSL